MATAGLLDPAEARPGPRHQSQALDLARALPRLTIEARRVASAVAHGLHGRRRAGLGETFWQFRHFTPGEAAARVDWRRSARDDTLYVREREWEAAHTVWLWADRSASMAYRSELAGAAKVERAVVLMLAVADLLVRGGERVGPIGGAPSASRTIVDSLAEAMLLDPRAGEGLPPPLPLAPLTGAVLVGDFLAPAEETVQVVRALGSRGAQGHAVMVLDPVEETFPFTGRVELVEPETGGRLTAGRIQSLRAGYGARLTAHRDTLRDELRRLGWTLTLHRTDRPASEALLALHALLVGQAGYQAGSSGG